MKENIGLFIIALALIFIIEDEDEAAKVAVYLLIGVVAYGVYKQFD